MSRVAEGEYRGPGGICLTVRGQKDGGCVVLVDLSDTTNAGWLFGPEGKFRGLVAESRPSGKGASSHEPWLQHDVPR